ncbi:biotin carboxylase [Trypanosoma theileri]|uniref:Biotin carboxylase n=1 Tax=Trypanosoma theileri TaxID=67003 RepID=A0A1X0P6I8_9TRYP|nr:biotin carboxylase [Trypanosoma theileri]ORC92253.1 biotin carboxylase [Trypanosoma theileri]
MRELEGKIVVLLRTSSVARAPVYRHLRAMGVLLLLVHPTPPAPAFDGLFLHQLTHDTHDPEALLPALTQFLADLNLTPDAVISFDEYAVYPAAVIAQQMGFRPIPLPPQELRGVSVKSIFRSWCRAHGVASPASVVLTRPSPEQQENLQTHIAEVLQQAGLTFPVVMKPCPGAGSLLAKLCFNVEEVREQALVMWRTFSTHADVKHFEALLNTAEETGEKKMQILVEEFIEGQEVDLDCCVENGQVVFCSISDNFETCPPFFVEEGGLCPSVLPQREQEALRQLLEQFVSIHGECLHGVLHFEAKYDFNRRQAYVIEVNCRLGSAETNTMVRTCYRGLELGESLVRCALGLSVVEQLARHYPEEVLKQKHMLTGLRGCFPPTCFCASVNVYPTMEGVLVRADVDTTDKSLVEYSVSGVPGVFVAPPPKAFYLLAWMVAKGATESVAREAIKRITNDFVQEISVAQ